MQTPEVRSLSGTSTTWLQRAEQGLSDRLTRRLLASVTERAKVSARPSLVTRLSMWLVVAPVHLVIAGSALGGTYLVVHGPGTMMRLLGIVLLLVAFATFPRPATLPPHVAALTPAEAPLLFGVLAEVAAVCGTRPPSKVVVIRDFNAFSTRVGWRRASVLGIGAPLWVASPPQARVGLLGHELGHFAHGDLTDGWWVWGAQNALLHWLDICRGPRHVLYSPSSIIVRYALLPFQAAVQSYLWLISKLNGPASQRREYLADLDAARAAGTLGAARMLEVLFTEPAVSTAMTRAAVSRDRPDMWELVRGDVGSFTDDDYRRRRSAPGAERSRIDDSHPATLLRLQLLESLPPASARVVMDTGRSHAVDAEIARPLALAARHIGEHIRYRR